jgi:hypothetical protein
LQDPNQTLTAIYLTADASGVAWAPVTPGAWGLDPTSIRATALAYPSLQPVLNDQLAYQVSAAIPDQYKGHMVNVYFDLYDNLDARASQAWFGDLRVIMVPEAEVWRFWLLAGCLAGIAKRLKR